MWIKTNNGNLINTNNISSIEKRKEFTYDHEILKFCEIWAYTGTVAPSDEGGFFYTRDLLARFKTEEAAQKYLDKLAEKLGAEVIDIDQD